MQQPEFDDDVPLPGGAEPDPSARRLAKAEHFNAVGRHDLAERELGAALAAAPNDPALLVELARALDGQGRAAQAREVARSAITANPEYAPALYQLAGLLAQAGEHHEAERMFLQALRDDPDFPPGLVAYGFLMLTTGHLEKAAALARHALRRDADYARAHHLLSLALGERRNKNAAVGHAAAGLHLEAGEGMSHTAIGVAYLRAGRPFRARRHLREALRLAPDDADLEQMYRNADRCCRWLYLPAYYVAILSEKLPGKAMGLWALVVGALVFLPFLGVPRPAIGWLGLGWFVLVVYTWVADLLVNAWVRLVPPR